MSYMFWKRRLKDTGRVKFQGLKRRNVKQEPVPLIIPQPAVQQVVVAEPEPVSNGSTTPVGQTIFVKLKRDRLLKLLAGILIGVLLLLLFLAVFASPGSISRNPVTNTGNIPTGISGGSGGYSGPTTTYYGGSTTSYYSPGVSGRGGTTSPTIEPYTGPIPTSVIIGDTTCLAKLAITNEEQIRGLRFIPSLESNECMVYLFNRAGYYQFWAKDMQFPMDIIFIGAGKQVNDIVEGVSPCTEPCITYKPESPAQYVIEANSGFVSEHFIERGDPVVFVY
jgi:uncharacterized membrane protein (UPF0127 family)